MKISFQKLTGLQMKQKERDSTYVSTIEKIQKCLRIICKSTKLVIVIIDIKLTLFIISKTKYQFF